MTTGTDPLASAADFVADGRYDDPAVRRYARILLADAVTLALAAHTVPGATAFGELGAGSGAHLAWSSGNRLGAADAVQANAVAVCARFQDDTDMRSWSHPGSFVVPSAVAAAVETGATYGALLDGLVAGYATTAWLGADGQVPLAMMAAGHRPSPTFAAAGASAAASRAAGLTAGQTLHALSGALLVGRGSLHSVGSGGEDWRLHNPGAARDGFLYALAARAGMVAGPGALDARFGFLRMIAGLGTVPEPLRTPPHQDLVLDVWTKALPTLGDNMAAALAARHLHHNGQGRTAVAGAPVTVRMNAHFAGFPGTLGRPPFPTLTSALSSVRFVTAQLLATGTLTSADYDRRDDETVVALAARVEVVADDDLGYRDAVVTIGGGGDAVTCRTADLPAELFFRDSAEQRRAAGELLGDRGGRVVDALLEGDENAAAAEIVHDAVGR
jgi:2-methylcitrate dehydratase PrpD